MFKRILLPIDVEHESSWKRALPIAERMAETFGAELHAMAVVHAFDYAVVGSFFPPDFEKKALAAAAEHVRKVVDEHCRNASKVTTHVAHGSPYAEILRAADKLACDVIVMAAHHPELGDFLLGSNAEKVVRHAKASVFVIRD